MQPPILFFLLGMLAVVVRSDLEVPQPIPRILSLLLLIAIGLKGGEQIAAGGLDRAALLTIGCAVGFSLLTPLICFAALRRRLGAFDAAAVAATYGSVSAVTFITAVNYLQRNDVAYGGHMVAALALMETPPIIIALMLARAFGGKSGNSKANSWQHQLHEALCNGSVLALIGSFAIGIVSGSTGGSVLRPLTADLFPLLLSLFLLDMGLVAGRRIPEAIRSGWVVPATAILIPVLSAAAALLVAHAIGAQRGDTLLLVVLAASASYIAVPAALRGALPEANPGLYVSMSLAITFPFNVLLGIPLYDSLIRHLSPVAP